jgi:hypothetical protein
MKIPEPQRPSLSGYVDAGKLLPWKWVDARMDGAKNYWINTKTADFPSSRPVWGVWDSPILLFSTGSAIGRNIAKDARVQVNLENADELVIIEGEAALLTDVAVGPVWAAAYNAKYNWDMPESIEDVYQVTPKRVLAWLCDSSGLDGGVGFSNSATEWRF